MKLLLWVLLLGLIANSPGYPQRAALEGVVLDSNCKPIEGAVVEIKYAGANSSNVVHTDNNGHFVQPGLSAGVYVITATAKDGRLIDLMAGFSLASGTNSITISDRWTSGGERCALDKPKAVVYSPPTKAIDAIEPSGRPNLPNTSCPVARREVARWLSLSPDLRLVSSNPELGTLTFTQPASISWSEARKYANVPFGSIVSDIQYFLDELVFNFQTAGQGCNITVTAKFIGRQRTNGPFFQRKDDIYTFPSKGKLEDEILRKFAPQR